MPRYKVTLTIEGSRSDIVTNKLKTDYPGCDVKVEKIETNRSRAERLMDAEGDVASAVSVLEELIGELEEWHDNMPENLQEGEKAEQITDCIGTLEEYKDSLESIDWSVEFPGMV